MNHTDRPDSNIHGTYTIATEWGPVVCKVVRHDWNGGTAYQPLTPCCGATAKGMQDLDGHGMTACRSCYSEVPGTFGTSWHGDDKWQAALANGEVTPVTR
jgi:hypothetical protein